MSQVDEPRNSAWLALPAMINAFLAKTQYITTVHRIAEHVDRVDRVNRACPVSDEPRNSAWLALPAAINAFLAKTQYITTVRSRRTS